MMIHLLINTIWVTPIWDILMIQMLWTTLMKENLVRGNNAPFMNKDLSKAFMNRLNWKIYLTKFLQMKITFYTRSKETSALIYWKKVKKEYYNNLDLHIFQDSKTFWKTIRPFFSDKQKDYQRVFVLIENDELTSNDKEVAENFNNYFIDVIENLNIEPYIDEAETEILSCTDIEAIINKYQNHPSVIKIKEHVYISNKFCFTNSKLKFKN